MNKSTFVNCDSYRLRDTFFYVALLKGHDLWSPAAGCFYWHTLTAAQVHVLHGTFILCRLRPPVDKTWCSKDLNHASRAFVWNVWRPRMLSTSEASLRLSEASAHSLHSTIKNVFKFFKMWPGVGMKSNYFQLQTQPVFWLMFKFVWRVDISAVLLDSVLMKQ